MMPCAQISTLFNICAIIITAAAEIDDIAGLLAISSFTPRTTSHQNNCRSSPHFAYGRVDGSSDFRLRRRRVIEDCHSFARRCRLRHFSSASNHGDDVRDGAANIANAKIAFSHDAHMSRACAAYFIPR